DRGLPADAGGRRPGRLPRFGSGHQARDPAAAPLRPWRRRALAQLPDPPALGQPVRACPDTCPSIPNEGWIMMHSYLPSPIGDLLLTGDGTHLTGLYTAEHVRMPTELGVRSDREFAEV